MSVNSTTLIPNNPSPGALAPVDKDNSAAQQEQEQQDLELRERQDAPELIDFLKKTIAGIRTQRDADWLQILNSQARCVAYYDDRQYGEARDGRWQDYQRRPGDIRPLDNQYKIQVDKLLMEIARAFPEIQTTASDPNDTKMVEGAKFAQYRLKTNRKRLLKKKFRLREAQALLLKTMTWRYTVFNKQAADSPTVKNPRMAKKTYGQTRSLRTCGLCGGPMKPIEAINTATGIAAMGDPENQSYKCAACGSNRVKMVEVSAQEREVVEGYDEVKGGCVQTYHIDPCMVRIALSARESVADSPFLWYTQMIARCILEAAYPGYKITNKGQLTEAAQYKRDAESAPSNANMGLAPYRAQNTEDTTSDGGNQFEELQFDLFWLDPSVYAGRTWAKDQVLRGGRVLKAGQGLETLCPEGTCIAATSANEILDLYPENKNKKWIFCVYGVREHALQGSGTNALLGPQDTRNDLKAYLILNNYINAGRREFIRSGSFTGNRLPTMDQVAVIEQVPDDKPVEGWAHSMAPGNPLPQQSMDLYQSETGAMTEAAGTFSVDTKGTPFANATKTATGIAAMRDDKVGRMGPNLMLISDMEEEWSYQVLEQEQDNFSPERYLKMANQSVTAEDTDGSITFSAEGVEAFMNMDIRADLDIDTVQGSWMPKTPAEQQAALEAFGQFAATVTEKMGADPRGQELIAMAADVFGIPLKLNGWSATEHVAAARIQALADTCQGMEKRGLKLQPVMAGENDEDQPTPELVQQVIINTPDAYIDNELDNHALFYSFYQEWWASDEGQSCSNLMRAVIKAEAILHRKGMVYKAAQMITDKMKSEAPQMIAAQKTAEEAAKNAPKEENKISVAYKDLPEDVKRQEEAKLGFQPSQMAPEQTDDGTAAETAKVQGTLATQQHKHELSAEQMREQAKLDMVERAHEAALDEAKAQAEHGRAQQLSAADREHEEGMKGADLMLKAQDSRESREHETHESAADRAHESTETEADRRHDAQTVAKEHSHESAEATAQRHAEAQKQAKDHQHQQKSQSEQQKGQERLVKLKPPTRRPTKK